MGGNSKLWVSRQLAGGRLAAQLRPAVGLEEVAAAFGISKVRAQQIEREALYKVELRLRARVGAMGNRR